ncbi:DUF2271 domain-containing protein [Pusillimonas sp. CC-YST705]|uniref:DUF2271 domain-containing protein n=1 Tax=Mesopusillimonas faecipullorum TaxID=2755040 RepID=A0ABS8CAU9_9BURK|nr:DUF2271 domain-containing protein [Mesopusillimonas faecipullorum]MCB5362754.1 DUF2271 domain-containing protein [Mesopusillimonas faecipullorum]
MKKTLLRTSLSCTLAGLFCAPLAQAESVSVKVGVPRLEVAEYHRPYVAIWLENADRSVVRDLAVWYDHAMPKAEGKKWLKDMRQWWRVSGRNQEELAEGVTGATRAPGSHTLTIAADDARLANLPAGKYELAVEASREKGGRELIRLPLEWPPAKAATAKDTGKTELGEIELIVAP